MATSTTLGARLSARRGGATPRPASRQPWRRRAATVSHSALGSGIRGTRRQRSVRGQSEVSAGRGFGGGTVTTKELCCPCGQHGLPYKKCCKPYHQASRVADTPRKLLETRFSAYEKGLSQYIVETELATDKDKNSEGRRQDIEASTEKLKFSNLKVLEEAEHEDTHAVIRFRYSVQVVGQKGFRAGKPEQIEETSHFVKKDGLWLFNDGMTDRNPS